MGWNNPPISWRELERRMSGRPMSDNSADNPEGDSAPGYSHKRPPYEPDEQRVRRPTGPVVPYAELHCHSNFSFLDGVSDPEELIEEAVRLGLDALAITDHDGFYAASRFAETALAYDLRTIYGAELSLGLNSPQNGVADPEGRHLLVLARGVEGYHRLAGAITEAQLRGDRKDVPTCGGGTGCTVGRQLDDLDRLPQRCRASGADHFRSGGGGGRAGPADGVVRS